MNLSLTKKVICLLGVSLFLTSCGESKKETTTSTEPEKKVEAPPPKQLPDTLEVQQEDSPQNARITKIYLITGIGTKGSNTIAIINDKIVTPGMKIDALATLDDIHPTYATIRVNGTKHLIRPKEIQNLLDQANKQWP